MAHLIKEAELRQRIGFMVDNYQPGDTKPYSKPLSRSDREINKRIMTDFLEKHPNSQFWTDHPEYMDEYLNDIDLSELGL